MEIWVEISLDAERGARRLVVEYGDRLMTAACRIVQNETDAEDLVFRTFSQAIRKIALYNGSCAFFSWLYQIMLNFRRMDLRKKGANCLVFDGEIPESVSDEADPAERLAAKSDHAAIRRAVGRLDEPLRTVVVLHYFEDMGVADMARVLDVPEGTVKFRLYAARHRLVEILAQTN